MKGMIAFSLLATAMSAQASAAAMGTITHETVEVLRGGLTGTDKDALLKQILDNLNQECVSLGGSVGEYAVETLPRSDGLFEVNARLTCAGI